MNFINKVLFLPKYLNGYGIGDPNRNGEYRFLKNYVKNKMVVFDIGANVGDYTKFLLNNFGSLEIHAFEPVKETFKELSNIIPMVPQEHKLKVNNLGLGDSNCDLDIYIYGKYAGINSLHYNPQVIENIKSLKKEKIKIITVDSYIKANKIDRVHLMKIDVEGFEAAVIDGATVSISNNIIQAIQFEYGGFWKLSSKSLIEVMNILLKFGFKIYRLTPWGKIPVVKIDLKLNNYQHSNYIALLDV